VSIDFNIKESNRIKGVWIITPSVFEDLRGNIWSSFTKSEIEDLLPKNLTFKHDKFSTSQNNVLRGIHGDSKSWKLVTCVHGEIQQVVVDLRPESPTYNQWQDFIINEKNQKLILIPPNMGNAYYVLSDSALYHYKLAYEGSYIDSKDQFSVKWNDSKINIKWRKNSPLLSERDK
jgi:dTDP-4-dehydrorhamnose 3,5-epimerase